ncbi:Putative transcriptional regulator (fragment) [Desulfamplus magnetovallimortis]|uniref:Putative transcriptional regulator n=1 Tax=Desulfamplus magnetovallimortis TaxID=1246637 RepID=A0A1W1H951_9BACT
MPVISYEEGLLERLQDPEYASAYIAEALMDGDQEVIRIAFQDVINANKLSLEINSKEAA